ncbi:MAG: segregation/condensation protein A [Candidatus Eisenbacteria bacterium]|uniref:Segregation and condensation protein A n=1 Tax=Eiseniibacteriota bacterium TaxID=2212470 RepID=A0A7Y2EBD0_UNCEI|nr:segregation/condensation protein A [Candidatus Eisenbacteria bacterium]
MLDPVDLNALQKKEEDADDTPGTQFELDWRTPLSVTLPDFEGPLDLLLHLIRRDELDIYNIPISHITDQYLSMLGAMQVFDLEVAGEFLVMAATLMRIKARLLLPTWPEDEDEEDPRFELMQQLLEYRRFKEAAQELQHREADQRLRFGRSVIPEVTSEGEIELAPVSHFTLIEVMKDVLARAGEDFFYEVEMEEVALEEKMELITTELRTSQRVLFLDLMTRFPRRMHVVVTFMAVLEMARLGQVMVAQESTFGQIWIYRPAVAEAEGETAETQESQEELRDGTTSTDTPN